MIITCVALSTEDLAPLSSALYFIFLAPNTMSDKGTCLHSLGFSFLIYKAGLIIFVPRQDQMR